MCQGEKGIETLSYLAVESLPVACRMRGSMLSRPSDAAHRELHGCATSRTLGQGDRTNGVGIEKFAQHGAN